MEICILVLSFLLGPRVTALLFPQTDQPAHGEVIPTELWDLGMPLLCPRSPNYISGPGKAVAAVPEHLAEPPGGLSPLVLSARLRFHLPAAVEQSCKPQPPYCAVPSKNRMGGGLGFFVFALCPFYGADL